MRKRDVVELLQDMPDEIDVQKLMYALYVRHKIERAEARPEDEDIPHDEVERLSEEWSR
jgi:hypothetical protein